MTGNNKGFTLIELLVAVGIFAVVVAITSGAFVTSLRGQRKTVTVQNVSENTRYAMETMGKELRMMQVNGATYVASTNLDGCVGKASCISFSSNMEHRDTAANLLFYLQGGQIMFNDGNGAEAITGSGIQVTDLEFSLTGEGDQNNHPRVTVIMQTKSNAAVDVDTTITTQTTISPRSL